MIKRLCRLNGWLPLVKDLVAQRAPYHRRGAKLFLVRCQASCKNIRHMKLEVVTTKMLLVFSVKSIIQKKAFINNFSLTFFLKTAKQTKGIKIIGDVIKKMSQHSFFELFGCNTKTPFTFANSPTEVSITMVQYRR